MVSMVEKKAIVSEFPTLSLSNGKDPSDRWSCHRYSQVSPRASGVLLGFPRSARDYRNNQLSPHVPLLAKLMRFCDLMKRENFLDDRTDLSCFDQRINFFQVAAARLGLDNAQAFAAHQASQRAGSKAGDRGGEELQLAGRPVRYGNCQGDQPAAKLQRPKRSGPYTLAHAVEHQIELGSYMLNF